MLHLLAYILFASVGGLFLLSGGVYLLERGRYTVSGKRKLQLEQQFLTWQIVVEEHKVAQVFKDVQYGSRTLRAFSLLGGGIAGLFIGLVSGCIALLTTGTLLDGNSIPVEPFAEILFLALNAGGAIGFVIALKSLRGRAAQRITYGDVRQRRTSDYRSLAVHFLPAVLVIWSISAAYLYFHSDGAPVYISLVTNMRVVLPAWIVGIIPVMMVLVVVFVEVISSRIATFPRLLLTAEPSTARRLDDMLRAVEVNKLIMGELWSIGLLAFAQL